MARLALVIGNKNYSSWSMRPWVLLKQAAIEFEEIQLWFDRDARPRGAERYSPTRLVPVLLVDGEPVWDSLAICETIAEMHTEKRLWPDGVRARQLARSICAEMHAGFRDLRSAMPMNVRADYRGRGMSPAVRKDIERVAAIWETCRTGYGAGGSMLFGAFTVADAFFAPVVSRFDTYGVELPAVAQAYAEAVRALPAVRDWTAQARRETAFVAADEPYAESKGAQQ